MLYLVATPIGNLGDITYRAIEILKLSDYILCEDTRHSQKLLQHYQVQKPLKSYHKFNEVEKESLILEDLAAGKNIALISDAGTPGISDPGMHLVQKCVEKGFPVFAVPGPCAAIAALISSGLSTDLFQFIGFLPKKAQELRSMLQSALQYSGTSVCYESPERLLKTLEVIQDLSPERTLVVFREITKKFEERRQGTAEELLFHWKTHPLKGEIVLLISGEPHPLLSWDHLTPHEHVEFLEKSYHLSHKEAIKLAAKQRGVPKRTIYASFL